MYRQAKVQTSAEVEILRMRSFSGLFKKRQEQTTEGRNRAAVKVWQKNKTKRSAGCCADIWVKAGGKLEDVP